MYVFFDIDHTLVSHVGTSHIPGETREAVRRLRERGHVPAIATGRAAFLSRRVADELGIELLVCADGAHLFNKGQELEAAWLSEEELAAFCQTARRLPDFSAALDDRFVYTDAKNEMFEEYFNGQAGYPCVRPLEAMGGAILCCLMVPPPLVGDYGFFTAPPEGVTLEFMKYFVEARRAGTSKWAGILRVLELLGAEAREVVTFGDGLNDIEMLRGASLGVAVAGADERVKAAADFVAGDIDAGGILSACAELGLIKTV